MSEKLNVARLHNEHTYTHSNSGINAKELEIWKKKHEGTKDAYVKMGIDWMEGKIEIKEFNGIKLTAKQRQYVNDKSAELLGAGGFRCLHGDTLIYNADSGVEERLRDIKKPFRVLSREFGKTKTAQALKPELIGTDELIKVTHSKGEFIAHKDHLVLTPHGYRPAKSLQVSDHLSYSEIPQGSISESFLSGLFLSGLRLIQKLANSLSSCFAYYYQYGEPLRKAVGSVSDVVQQLVGVLSRIPFVQKGVLYVVLGYNHLYQSLSHLSKNRDFLPARVFFGVVRILTLSFEYILHLVRGFFQSLRMFSHHLIADGFYLFCPYLNPTTQVTKIELMVGDYFDLHVIGTHNYLAGGVFHHNCGKTTGLAIKLWLICQWFPGNQILLGRKARSDLDSTTIPTLMEYFPSGSYEYKVGPGIFYFPNGSQIHCRGLDTSVGGDDTKKASQKIKGMTLGGAALDQLEEVDYQMYEMLSGRMTMRIPYRPVFSTTNPANFWAYEYFKSNPRKSTSLIEMGMIDNAENLPDGFIESQMQKPKSYVDRFVKGIWDPTLIEEGRVFPEDYLNTSWVKSPVREIHGIKIYEEPRNTTYQLGIDPSTGDGDPCYMYMVDKETGRQVASFHGLVPTQVQIEAAHRMCILYSISSDVLAIPEVNGVGQAFIEGFKKLWNNIYIREVFNKRDSKKTDKLGYYTTFANKAQLISNTQNLLSFGYPKIADRQVVNEMQMFVYSNEAKKYGASCPHPYHDDTVMAMMLAHVNLEPKSTSEEMEDEMVLYSDSLMYN